MALSTDSALLAMLFMVTFIRGQYYEQDECRFCPDTWIRFRDSCYHFVDHTAYSWSDADAYCQNEMAHLVSVETAAEDKFITHYCMKLHKGSNDDRQDIKYWTGASDSIVEGDWHWYHNNAKMNFTHWSPGQPDSYHHYNEDCVLLYGSHNFAWYDFPCSTKAVPICERESPRPVTINTIIG